MHVNDIEARGTPPYIMWTGKKAIDGSSIGDPQPSGEKTWPGALALLYDVTEGGEFAIDEQIKDSTDRTVFSVKNPEDLALLKSITNTILS